MKWVKVKLFTLSAKMPTKGSMYASGFDLYVSSPCSIRPGQTVVLETGIGIEMPARIEGVIRPRSSASRSGILVHTGTIDNDYRGQIGVIVTNAASFTQHVPSGTRIAQIVFHELPQVALVATDELGETERGEGGFGSTGL